MCTIISSYFLFFFNDTATTEIYTLSLHDALPISFERHVAHNLLDVNKSRLSLELQFRFFRHGQLQTSSRIRRLRSEEHTSELQSQSNLVCRLLLEKKKKHKEPHHCLTYEHSNTID